MRISYQIRSNWDLHYVMPTVSEAQAMCEARLDPNSTLAIDHSRVRSQLSS
jgi:hypothetical protein